MKRLLVICFIFCLLFLTESTILAVNMDLPFPTITPDKGVFYSIKRFTEKLLVFTHIGRESKVDYYRNLSLNRLSELNYIVKNKQLLHLEQATQRLSYQVGILSDYVSANKKDLSEKRKYIVEEMTSYKNLLATLRDNYPANSSFWMLVQHNINSIDINLEKLH